MCHFVWLKQEEICGIETFSAMCYYPLFSTPSGFVTVFNTKERKDFHCRIYALPASVSSWPWPLVNTWRTVRSFAKSLRSFAKSLRSFAEYDFNIFAANQQIYSAKVILLRFIKICQDQRCPSTTTFATRGVLWLNFQP